MGVNCNLELRLLPPSAASNYTADHNDHHRDNHHHRGLPMLDFLSRTKNTAPNERQQQQQQQPQHRQELAIFYNGQLKVCDVTEFQARAIIMHASRETTEDKPKTELELGSCCSSLTQQFPANTSSTASLSMKRSLKRFLQKRKHRIQTASPYSRSL